MCKKVDRKYPTIYPVCHTEALAEVSQKQKRDFSVANLLKNDKKPHRDFSHSTNAQNDKTLKDYNDTSNRNGDFSPTANMTKQTNHNMTTLTS